MELKSPLLTDRVVLITGGTGSFGKQFVETVLREDTPRKLIIFSRDELKQYDMRQRFSEQKYPCMRYFIGDVRDKDRLHRAMRRRRHRDSRGGAQAGAGGGIQPYRSDQDQRARRRQPHRCGDRPRCASR